MSDDLTGLDEATADALRELIAMGLVRRVNKRGLARYEATPLAEVEAEREKQERLRESDG